MIFGCKYTHYFLFYLIFVRVFLKFGIKFLQKVFRKTLDGISDAQERAGVIHCQL